jgi:hypothetical protein
MYVKVGGIIVQLNVQVFVTSLVLELFLLTFTALPLKLIPTSHCHWVNNNSP